MSDFDGTANRGKYAARTLEEKDREMRRVDPAYELAVNPDGTWSDLGTTADRLYGEAVEMMTTIPPDASPRDLCAHLMTLHLFTAERIEVLEFRIGELEKAKGPR